ncbi:polysaccharide pyruvyl transferase family protein [Mesorhizobium sp. B4-1-4]|uniref:polysaccharide pyruvyl transferase family protein n=1 Tax=Mesorhizobium sp. B4-1-4 TaxID=2589888 RepID=UPI001127F358|nr:polysaccharide pyruvyl transferase family protein [Mesorhizobium sp. B4-1-4]UCI29354.1 polysaccharide pyruvyl transferase family protein [Mesorhizobium sp. B4-1-4]
MKTVIDIRSNNSNAPPLTPSGNQRARNIAWSAKAPTVALFGNFGSNNSGNEGSLLTMVDFLRRARPEARLFCVCAHPSVVRSTLGIPAISIRRTSRYSEISNKAVRIPVRLIGKIRDLARAFREIRQADVMIVPGTGILDDFGDPPQGMPLDVLMWCLAARISGTKVAFASVGAGPIDHPVSRWLLVLAAKLAHYRSYRDTPSRVFMQNAGLNTANDAVYPDIVFKLATPAVFARRTSETGALTVGVGVMKYKGWYGFAKGGQAIFDTYLDKLAQFVIYLLERGHRVKLLTGETTDMEAVDALLLRLRSSAADRLPERVGTGLSDSLHSLMEQISETDIVVATRFHNIVCALKMEKPVISLGYSEKNDALLAEMGLGEYCQHVNAFDVDLLTAHFERAVAANQEIKGLIRARNLAFSKLLDMQYERLLSEVLPPAADVTSRFAEPAAGGRNA